MPRRLSETGEGSGQSPEGQLQISQENHPELGKRALPLHLAPHPPYPSTPPSPPIPPPRPPSPLSVHPAPHSPPSLHPSRASQPGRGPTQLLQKFPFPGAGLRLVRDQIHFPVSFSRSGPAFNKANAWAVTSRRRRPAGSAHRPPALLAHAHTPARARAPPLRRPGSQS